jgi:hypothetical protein
MLNINAVLLFYAFCNFTEKVFNFMSLLIFMLSKVVFEKGINFQGSINFMRKKHPLLS